MKKILWLLLLLPGIAAGQIYINSYQFAAPAAALVLDDYPNAELALSFRKLRTAYTGDCIVVRRSSDSLLDTIGFVSNYLDTATLKTFCASTNCFVRVIYDQSGNARDFRQDTTSRQPRIVNSGVLEKSENEVALYGDGTDDEMSFPNNNAWANFMHDGTAHSFYWVGQPSDVTNPNDVLTFFGSNRLTGSARGMAFFHDDRSSVSRNNAIGHFVTRASSDPQPITNISANNLVTANAQTLIYIDADADNATAADRSSMYHENGSAIKNNTSTNNPTAGSMSYDFFIMNAGGAPYNWQKGFFQELVIWDTDQSANRSGIQSNINTFYSIY
jgi:hypothetical protein